MVELVPGATLRILGAYQGTSRALSTASALDLNVELAGCQCASQIHCGLFEKLQAPYTFDGAFSAEKRF
jgi:hypothetical protein